MTIPDAQVAPSNVGQSQAWDGPEGRFWADHSARIDAVMAGYREPLLAAASIRPDSRVLDIGCGTGELTRAAGRAAAHGEAFGIDLSHAMITAARRLTHADEAPNVGFAQGDAQVYRYPASRFDRVVSRAGVMFFGDPVAAFRHIGTALAPRARLALLTWQPSSRNEWVQAFAAALPPGPELPPPEGPGPFSLSDPSVVRTVLTTAGFGEVNLLPVDAPMVFGRDVDDAHAFVSGLLAGRLRECDPPARRLALAALRTTMAQHCTQDGVAFGSAAWVISATWPALAAAAPRSIA